MDIYMDACCFNRPYDDLDQVRIRLESEAVIAILARCERAGWRLCGSDVLEFELYNATDRERLDRVLVGYSVATRQLVVNDEVEALALTYQACGVKEFDSLHLALAETAGVDALLTTDDRFLKTARRLQTVINVANPVAWLMEVLRNDGKN